MISIFLFTLLAATTPATPPPAPATECVAATAIAAEGTLKEATPPAEATAPRTPQKPKPKRPLNERARVWLV